jgi:transposase InsO family protein
MIQDEAKKRAHIISFWKKYGREATAEAYGVKERTLYLWQAKLKVGKGRLESLNSGSRTPKNKRKRRYDYRIIEEIKRLRETYPNLGEKKLYPLLKEYCDSINLTCPKSATISNIMRDKGGMRLVPQKITGTGRVKPYTRQKALRKPKDIAITQPGSLVALDTVEYHLNGTRRYIITVEDIYSRFAFAWSTISHASKATEEFFTLWLKVFPHQTTFVLTDNGSEFKKDFARHLHELQITHYKTYPKTPKMNAHIERFNRTIQEEFADYHRQLLLEPERFNEKLMDWLIFYNTKRVHYAFKNQLTPVQYLLQYEANLSRDCKSTLGYTNT